jgi:hypothetical protein
MSACVVEEIHRMTDPPVGSRWQDRHQRPGESPYPPMTPHKVFVGAVVDDRVYFYHETHLEQKGLSAPWCSMTVNDFLSSYVRARLHRKDY